MSAHKFPRDWIPYSGKLRVAAVSLTVGALALPLAMLFLGAFRTSPFSSGRWTLAGFARVFTEGGTAKLLATTTTYALCVAITGVILAMAFAFLRARASTPIALLTTPLMMVLIAMPKSFYALAWGLVGGGTGGLLNQGISALGLGTLVGSLSLQNWFGVFLVSVFKITAIAYLLVVGPVRNRNRLYVDAARIHGDGRARALFRIDLPMLRPAILAAFFLSFALSLQEFEVPAILGLPGGIRVFSTGIYRYLRDPLGPDYASASVSALVLLVLIGFVVVLQQRLLAERSYVSVGGKALPPMSSTPKRSVQVIDASGVILWSILAILLPIAQMILGSFQSYFGVFSGLTLDHYASIANDSQSVSAVLTTLATALGGGILTVAISFMAAYLIVRSHSTLRTLARAVSWFPVALPGLVYGLALLWVFTAIPGIRALYGTPVPLFIGLVSVGIPFAVRALEGSLEQVSPELEEAGRISGDGAIMAILRTTFRVVTPSVFAAWVLASLVIAGSLDVPLLLSSTRVNTVATLSFSLYNNGDMSAAAALYCSLLGIFVLIALAALAGRYSISLLKRRTKVDINTHSERVSGVSIENQGTRAHLF